MTPTKNHHIFSPPIISPCPFFYRILFLISCLYWVGEMGTRVHCRDVVLPVALFSEALLNCLKHFRLVLLADSTHLMIRLRVRE